MFSKTCREGLQVEQVGTVSVVSLPGPALLDPVVIQDIGQQLTALAEGLGEQPRLVLNFGEVEYLSSAMVGKVMALHNQVALADGRLAVCGVRKHLTMVFTITGLHRVLHLYPDEADALLSC